MNGQHRDLSIEHLNLEHWSQIAAAKSGEFFSLACRSGARLGKIDQRRIAGYSTFGFHLGMMLQILDDLVDLSTFKAEHNNIRCFNKTITIREAV